MKKIIKYIILSILMFVPCLKLNAISSDSVNYTVEKYYISSEIEIAGGLRVKEFIEVDGTYNGYLLNIAMKNENVPTFTGKDSDLEGSSIYNPTSIENLKVGVLKDIDDAKLETLFDEDIDSKITYFTESDTPQNGDKKLYSLNVDNNDNYSIKMYNETLNGKTVFYLDYVVTNVLAEHKDCAEFYYTFISPDYQDSVKDMKIFVALPWASEDLFKVWAHGQYNASVQRDSEKRYVAADVQNYEVGTGVDIRIIFDKELFSININESKKSGMNAIPIIEKIEESRASEANKYRTMQSIFYYGMYVLEFAYVIALLFFIFYIYFKYDKEYKSTFKGKYYREFIDDYNVEDIDYLMHKNITNEAFSSSILNMIYKKNIDIEEIELKKDKKDYKFIKKSEENLNESEMVIMDLLFNKIGEKNEVLLSNIKSTAKLTSSTGKNIVFDEYTRWKDHVIRDSKKQEFYVDNQKIKFIFSLYGIIGIGIFILDSKLMIVWPILRALVLVLSIIFIIYVISFKKRTVKGNEDYNKWKAFKNFLNDFGRFNEKELPEIKLWERYLVYATIFGVADKLRKTMKVKFEEINPNYTMRNSMFDYYIFTNITNDITHSINSSVVAATNSVNTYKANNSSSGGGFGGGFSSGGGFGGGGGASGGGF